MSRAGPVPKDLTALAIVVVCLDVASLFPVVRSSPIRALLGLAVALFVPGYAILAVLFPRGITHPGKKSVVDRVGLSVGLSVVVAVAVGLILGLTPVGLGMETTLGTLSGIALLALAIATVRRRRAERPQTAGSTSSPETSTPSSETSTSSPETSISSTETNDENSSTGFAAKLASVRSELARAPVTNAVIALALLGATAAIVALVLGPAGAAPTEVYFAGDATGDRHSTGAGYLGYPATEDGNGPLPVEVVNHADHPREYTLVVSLQRVENGTRSRAIPVNVTDERQIDRLRETVGPDREWVARPAIDLRNRTADRLVVRVYEGGERLHSLHLWLPDRADDGTSRLLAGSRADGGDPP